MPIAVCIEGQTSNLKSKQATQKQQEYPALETANKHPGQLGKSCITSNILTAGLWLSAAA